MLEVLHEVWPHLKAYEYPEFFNTFKLANADFECLRGHGQGMANALTTLM